MLLGIGDYLIIVRTIYKKWGLVFVKTDQSDK